MNKKVFASSIFCTSTSAFGLIIGTAAWFAMNKDVNASDMAVQVSNTAFGDVSLHSYPVDAITDNHNGTYTYSFVEEEAKELPCYDQSNLIYSKYEKALVFDIVFIPYKVGDYKINVSTTYDEFTLDEDNHLSNCVNVSSVSKDPTRNLLTTTMMTSFVSIEAQNVSKVTTLNFGDLTFTAEVENQPIHHYYVIEYNTEVVEYISNNARDEHGNYRQFTHYDNDLLFKLISLEDE